MNICFIGSLRYPGIYGDTRRMIPLFKHLQKKGHKIILIIVDEKSDDKCEIYEGFEIHRVGIKSLQKLGKISKLLAKIIIPFKVFKKAKKIVKNNKINIVYGFNPEIYGGLPALFVAKICKKPFVLEFNDLVANFSIEYNSYLFIKKIYLYFRQIIQEKIPFKSDMIITTRFIRKMLLSKGIDSNKIKEIFCGVDPNVFHPKMSGKNIIKKYKLEGFKIILYSGAIYPSFGIDTLLYSMPLILNKIPNVKLMLVGFAPKNIIKYFKNKTIKLNISNNVIFTGPQPHESIPSFISASDVCVNVFPYTIMCRAGSPLKVFEYMSMEKPVIHTNLESIEDVIIQKKTGLLVKPDDSEELAEKIIYLLKTPNFGKKLGKNARKLIIEKYSWDKLGDELNESLYKAIENYKSNHNDKFLSVNHVV